MADYKRKRGGWESASPQRQFTSKPQGSPVITHAMILIRKAEAASTTGWADPCTGRGSTFLSSPAELEQEELSIGTVCVGE